MNARRYIINAANYILGRAIAIKNRNCNKAITNDILAMTVAGYAYAFVISAIAHSIAQNIEVKLATKALKIFS